jgi:glycosyltransferase involved in cell wall biosynthesis
VRLLCYRHDAVDLMQVMDVVVLPSTGEEGLGMCLVEAAFLGKASVGSGVDGIAEAIADGETGLLVKPRDTQALAEGIGALLSEPERRRKMGEAARLRAQQLFTVEAQAEAMEGLFTQLVARRQRSPVTS